MGIGMNRLIDSEEGRKLLRDSVVRHGFATSLEEFDSMSAAGQMSVLLQIDEIEYQRFLSEFPKEPDEEQWHED